MGFLSACFLLQYIGVLVLLYDADGIQEVFLYHPPENFNLVAAIVRSATGTHVTHKSVSRQKAGLPRRLDGANGLRMAHSED